jgi:hypothetical protein
LGEFEDVESSTKRIITRERFGKMMLEEGAHNAGFNIAIISSAVLTTFLSLGIDAPALMQRTTEVTKRVIRPLIGYALGFGLLFQIESMREGTTDDPEEIAALQAEADERGLDSRMELMESFSVDFEESYSYHLAPDPSLLLSIAIDAGDSKYGLGPNTRKRLELLMAILSICNIEADKKTIEKVDNDLKQELSLITSLGSSSVSEKVERLHADLVESSFDSRKLITGEASTFWVKSFGMSTYEVMWARFRQALAANFSLSISERDVKRIQFLLSDPRGMVTLDGFRSFTGGASGGSMVKAVKSVSGGSMNKVMKNLSGSNQLPDGLGDLVVPPRGSTGSPGKQATSSRPSSPASLNLAAAIGSESGEADADTRSTSPSSSSSPSPSQKRLGKLRAGRGTASA